ncbi:unnamed protein product [Caretta caretta]
MWEDAYSSALHISTIDNIRLEKKGVLVPPCVCLFLMKWSSLQPNEKKSSVGHSRGKSTSTWLRAVT